MKRKVLRQFGFIVLVLLHSTTLVFGQKPCEGYFAAHKGAKYEITAYDKKNQVEAVSSFLVKDASSGKVVIHLVTNAKGKETLNTEYDITCDGKVAIMDQKKIVSNQLKSNMKDPNITVDVSGKDVESPLDISVGQTLPDSEIDIAVKSSAMNMNMYFKTLDRKVVGQEKITVPAGTFDCMIITATTDTKLLFPKKGTTKQWVAKGVGMVKQETYAKNGKIEKTELLTSFSK